MNWAVISVPRVKGSEEERILIVSVVCNQYHVMSFLLILLFFQFSLWHRHLYHHHRCSSDSTPRDGLNWVVSLPHHIFHSQSPSPSLQARFYSSQQEQAALSHAHTQHHVTPKSPFQLKFDKLQLLRCNMLQMVLVPYGHSMPILLKCYGWTLFEWVII